MSDLNPGGAAAARRRLAGKLAVVAVLFGAFLTWLDDGPVRLDGIQGPNNGWLAVLVAALTLVWLSWLERGSWIGVVGVLGSGLVIGWTALENWLDARAAFGASAAPGLLLVVAASAVLTALAVLRGLELFRGPTHRSTERVV
jgi:hypothetical protein